MFKRMFSVSERSARTLSPSVERDLSVLGTRRERAKQRTTVYGRFGTTVSDAHGWRCTFMSL